MKSRRQADDRDFGVSLATVRYLDFTSSALDDFKQGTNMS